ncbi:MAG: DUF4402 domain-containing protein [Alphaproteobacteria bacterium]|nr:DUF4402 domain-containing protein [Alphaproteobacteria bacterium]
MKNMLKISIFAMGLILSSGAMAATGTGHAQAELSTPLSISANSINFGTIAIDPAAGPQTISLTTADTVTCPATYVCSGSANSSNPIISGAPFQSFSLSLVGSTATLSDGLGHVLTFDPEIIIIGSGDTFSATLGAGGTYGVAIGGSINFTGNELAGIYSSSNAGGSGYIINVNY